MSRGVEGEARVAEIRAVEEREERLIRNRSGTGR